LKFQDSVLKFQTVQTRAEVDVASVTVDPEEVKLQRLELPPEEDVIETREKLLGLVDLGPDAPRSGRSGYDREDEFGDDVVGPEDEGGADSAADDDA